MPGLLYADDMVLCDESEEDLRVMVGRFAEVCRRSGLKVNAGRSKVMVLGVEEGLESEVCVGGIHLEHLTEFKFLQYVLDESGTDEAECSKKVVYGKRVAGAIRLMLGVCSFSMLRSCMSHCWCLFLLMVVRQ